MRRDYIRKDNMEKDYTRKNYIKKDYIERNYIKKKLYHTKQKLYREKTI